LKFTVGESDESGCHGVLAGSEYPGNVKLNGSSAEPEKYRKARKNKS
jgi:hypothetical protein